MPWPRSVGLGGVAISLWVAAAHAGSASTHLLVRATVVRSCTVRTAGDDAAVVACGKDALPRNASRDLFTFTGAPTTTPRVSTVRIPAASDAPDAHAPESILVTVDY